MICQKILKDLSVLFQATSFLVLVSLSENKAFSYPNNEVSTTMYIIYQARDLCKINWIDKSFCFLSQAHYTLTNSPDRITRATYNNSCKLVLLVSLALPFFYFLLNFLSTLYVVQLLNFSHSASFTYTNLHALG